MKNMLHCLVILEVEQDAGSLNFLYLDVWLIIIQIKGVGKAFIRMIYSRIT